MKKFLVKNVVSMIFVALIFFTSVLYFRVFEVRAVEKNGYTIVLDAGHGARDGGSVGVNGTIEKEINLEYVLALKEKLVKNGFNVVLTREDDNPLYSEFDKSKKIGDMNKRMEIIKKSNPSLVVSIHMNSFSDSSVKGATCYYKIDDEASKSCAGVIQKSLQAYCDAKTKEAKGGDFFLLNCSYYTSVLIECGYLSNSDEEKLLNSDSYKEKIVNAIYSGILLYYGKC